MLSHTLAMIGELLNFLGALTMALDIFLRGREREREEKLRRIAEIGRQYNLTRTIYRGSRITSSNFVYSILDRRATVIAYIGAALFASGFLLLLIHHGMELREQMNQSAVKCVSLTTFVGKSDLTS
jgi:hypothetical protein